MLIYCSHSFIYLIYIDLSTNHCSINKYKWLWQMGKLYSKCFSFCCQSDLQGCAWQLQQVLITL